MPLIARTSGAVVVRTDFSDDEVWTEVLVAMLAETDEGFRAYVEIVDDKVFEGCSVNDVLDQSPTTTSTASSLSWTT